MPVRLTPQEESLLLIECCKELTVLCTDTHKDAPSPVPELHMLALEAMGRVSDLMQSAWDADPDLVDPALAPNFEIDVPRQLALLASTEHDPVRAATLSLVCRSAPESVVGRVRNATSDGERLSILQDWWRRHGAAFLPLDKIDRELSASRRWRRVRAARELVNLGGPELVDPNTRDLCRTGLQSWRESRRPGPRAVEP